MKVKEIYETAVSFIPERPEDNPELRKFAVPWCNFLLAEALPYENAFRRGKKMPELGAPAKVISDEDEVPYNENLVSRAFPYGMARWIFRENDDVAGSHEYYSLYVNACREAIPLVIEEIKDIY